MYTVYIHWCIWMYAPYFHVVSFICLLSLCYLWYENIINLLIGLKVVESSGTMQTVPGRHDQAILSSSRALWGLLIWEDWELPLGESWPNLGLLLLLANSKKRTWFWKMVYHQLLDGYSKRLHVSWALKYCYVVHNQSEANIASFQLTKDQ